MSKYENKPLFLQRIKDNNISPDSVEDRLRRHDEVSKTVRRIMYAIVAYSLFCLITIGYDDVSLVVAGSTVKIPFANSPVDYRAFLIIGPIILFCLWIYLIVFLNQLKRIHNMSDATLLPFIFNINSIFTRILSAILLWWLTPIIFGIFVWKAWPLGTTGAILLAFTLMFILLTTFLSVFYYKEKEGLFWFLYIVFPMCILYLLAALGVHERNLYILDRDLSGKNFRNVIWQGATLENVELVKARLKNVNLRDAKLDGVNFSNANLVKADFRGSNIINSKFNETDLSEAVISKTDIDKFNSIIQGTKIGGGVSGVANSSEFKKLAWASTLNFKQTTINSSFKGAILTGATLSYADVTESIFENAILDNADLTGTDFRLAKGLKCEQLKRAKSIEKINLPEGMICN